MTANSQQLQTISGCVGTIRLSGKLRAYSDTICQCLQQTAPNTSIKHFLIPSTNTTWYLRLYLGICNTTSHLIQVSDKHLIPATPHHTWYITHIKIPPTLPTSIWDLRHPATLEVVIKHFPTPPKHNFRRLHAVIRSDCHWSIRPDKQVTRRPKNGEGDLSCH